MQQSIVFKTFKQQSSPYSQQNNFPRPAFATVSKNFTKEACLNLLDQIMENQVVSNVETSHKMKPFDESFPFNFPLKLHPPKAKLQTWERKNIHQTNLKFRVQALTFQAVTCRRIPRRQDNRLIETCVRWGMSS